MNACLPASPLDRQLHDERQQVWAEYHAEVADHVVDADRAMDQASADLAKALDAARGDYNATCEAAYNSHAEATAAAMSAYRTSTDSARRQRDDQLAGLLGQVF